MIPTLQRVANEIQNKVRQLPGAVDVSSNLVSGQPEVVARINRSIAADLGFSVGSIASQLRGMVEGVVPTRLRETDREHDIRVRLAPEYRNDPGAVLRRLFTPLPGRRCVPAMSWSSRRRLVPATSIGNSAGNRPRSGSTWPPATRSAM